MMDSIYGLGLVILIWGLTGCAPTVKIDTPQPIRVDISMTIDVNERGGGSKEVNKRSLGTDEIDALRRRDSRSSEVWAMKNDSVVIENEHGYLEARSKSGWKPEYVHQLVEEENKDRRILYEAEAVATARPLVVVEEQAGKRMRLQAYGRK